MRLRALIGLGLIIAFAGALILASAPEWHQRLHGSGPEHQCAATLLAAGECASIASPVTLGTIVRRFSGVVQVRDLHLVRAPVPVSILEHGPPVL